LRYAESRAHRVVNDDAAGGVAVVEAGARKHQQRGAGIGEAGHRGAGGDVISVNAAAGAAIGAAGVRAQENVIRGSAVAAAANGYAAADLGEDEIAGCASSGGGERVDRRSAGIGGGDGGVGYRSGSVAGRTTGAARGSGVDRGFEI